MKMDGAPTFAVNAAKLTIRYMQDLEKYFAKRTVPTGQRLELAIEGLQGHVRNWAEIYRQEWKNYDDFHTEFLRSFWSTQDQLSIRHQINTARWNDKYTMTEHFAHYVSLAHLLTQPMPEELLVGSIMRHYPTHTQALWSLKGNPSVT